MCIAMETAFKYFFFLILFSLHKLAFPSCITNEKVNVSEMLSQEEGSFLNISYLLNISENSVSTDTSYLYVDVCQNNNRSLLCEFIRPRQSQHFTVKYNDVRDDTLCVAERHSFTSSTRTWKIKISQLLTRSITAIYLHTENKTLHRQTVLLIPIDVTYPSKVTHLTVDGQEVNSTHLINEGEVNVCCSFNRGNPPAVFHLLDIRGKEIAHKVDKNAIKMERGEEHLKVSLSVRCQDDWPTVRCEGSGSERNRSVSFLVRCAPQFVDGPVTLESSEFEKVTFRVKAHTTIFNKCFLTPIPLQDTFIPKVKCNLSGEPPNLVFTLHLEENITQGIWKITLGNEIGYDITTVVITEYSKTTAQCVESVSETTIQYVESVGVLTIGLSCGGVLLVAVIVNVVFCLKIRTREHKNDSDTPVAEATNYSHSRSVHDREVNIGEILSQKEGTFLNISYLLNISENSVSTDTSRLYVDVCHSNNRSLLCTFVRPKQFQDFTVLYYDVGDDTLCVAERRYITSSMRTWEIKISQLLTRSITAIYLDTQDKPLHRQTVLHIPIDVTYPSKVTHLTVDGQEVNSTHLINEGEVNVCCSFNRGNPPVVFYLLDISGKEIAHKVDKNAIKMERGEEHLKVSLSVRCQDDWPTVRCEGNGSQRNRSVSFLVRCAPQFVDGPVTLVSSELEKVTFRVKAHTTIFIKCFLTPTPLQDTFIPKVKCNLSGEPPNLVLTLHPEENITQGIWKITLGNEIGYDITTVNIAEYTMSETTTPSVESVSETTTQCVESVGVLAIGLSCAGVLLVAVIANVVVCIKIRTREHKNDSDTPVAEATNCSHSRGVHEKGCTQEYLVLSK